jgi:tRNA-dihydrouridine synthase B
MRIGTLETGRIFLAPLSGVADSSFRRICRRFGADAVYSEMISSAGLVKSNWRSKALLEFHEDERPIGLQLFGRDPVLMGEATVVAAEGAPDFIDINFSCPAGKIVSRGAGAALLREPDVIGHIARTVVRATAKPVTAKIRIGWDRAQINAVQIARLLEDAGVQAVSVHGRTWEQGFRETSSWDVVGEVKRAVQVPVILSGDVRTADDARRAFDQTGCDAIMVGRGSFGRPWVFAEIRETLAGRPYAAPSFPELVKILFEHLDLGIAQFGERIAVRRFRKHLLWYTKGMRGVVRLRSEMGTVVAREDVASMLARLEEDGAQAEDING